MKTLLKHTSIACAVVSSFLAPAVVLAEEPTKVNAFNFTRAESDLQMKGYLEKAGGIGKFLHMRDVYSVENQTTIRGNRDTIYSLAIFDLTTPVTITKPDTDGRFQSMLLSSQDHSIFPAEHKAGEFKITKEKIGTRYVFVLFRTFTNPNDPKDLKIARALQDKIKVEQASPGKFEIPDWDEKSLIKVRGGINAIAEETITDFNGYFGINGKIDPIKHLLGTAFAWGGNREQDAMYVNGAPEKNDGKVAHVLNVKDVPVDGFWSVSVYNAEGFYEKNDLNAYSFNNLTAKPNKDGSFTLHFGGDPKSINYIPITDGWNYIARMYQPKKEVLDGTWKFPEILPVK